MKSRSVKKQKKYSLLERIIEINLTILMKNWNLYIGITKGKKIQFAQRY